MKRITPILILVLFVSSCNDYSSNNNELKALRIKVDSLKKLTNEKSIKPNERITTFLTFQENNAEEAMNFYISLFKNSKINEVKRYGKDGPAKEGTIMFAKFELNGSQFACSDSYIKHEWDFSPAVSNYIECENEGELESLFSKLSQNGSVTMPLNNYGFSQRFGWVVDQFGVSWQLNLP